MSAWNRLLWSRIVSIDRLPRAQLIFVPANKGLDVVLHQTLVTVLLTAIIKERRKNVLGIIFVSLNSEAEFQHCLHITLENQGFRTS
jgi:hypothetical protein